MKLIVKNFKGLRSAEIEAEDGATIVVEGSTGSGKTSFCEALRCAMNGQWKLFPSMTKTDSKLVINRKSVSEENLGESVEPSSAYIHIEERNQDALVDWTNISVSGTGLNSVSDSVAIASGYLNICEMSPSDVALGLTDLLKTEPEKGDLLEALPSLSEKKISTLWDEIQKMGWDEQVKSLQTTGRIRKGDWETITGEKYGSKKGDHYIPEGWTTDMANENMVNMQEALSQAQAKNDAAIQAQGISESDRERLQEESESIHNLTHKEKTLFEKKMAMHKEVDSLQNALNEIPSEGEYVECPHCTNLVSILGRKLAKYTKPTAKQVASRESITHKSKDLLAQIRGIDTEINSLNGLIANAKRAEQHLSDAKNKTVISASELNQAREDLENAKMRVSAFQKKTKADALHSEIQSLALMINAISPDGIRKKVMLEKLAKFNGLLEKISPQRKVKVSEDLRFSINNMPYWLASNGQKQFLVGVLQIAFTQISKSPITIIDCDKMSDDWYGDLRAIADRAKFSVVLTGIGIPNPTHKISNDVSGMNGVLEAV
jgi:hypothetical protein